MNTEASGCRPVNGGSVGSAGDRSVVGCLDDFEPLAIATDALIRTGLLRGEPVPWIVSVHDLHIVEMPLASPALFFIYLRRRTEPQAARTFVAVDELDVLMWFMQGGLYFEPDPDELHKRYPASPPPTKGDRRRLRRDFPTSVGTITDDLDAWIYFEEGASVIEAPNRPGWIIKMFCGLSHSLLTASRTMAGFG